MNEWFAMLEHARIVLDQALFEVQNRGVEPLELLSIRADLERRMREPQPHSAHIPRFIPCDIGLCARNTIINYWHKDQELVVSAGYVIQPSATRPQSFSRPYYIDPVTGKRRCKGLFALEHYYDRQEWLFDMTFVGWQQSRPPLRKKLLETLQSHFDAQTTSYRFWIRLNDVFFFDEGITPQRRDELNERSRYVESVRDAKFVLCPRGCGTNSIRFFETLAVCNVPVFVGGSNTKFPLDWIIDWDSAVFRISEEELDSRRFVDILMGILSTSTATINARRRYIFRVYHQFLAPERRTVFEMLVWIRTADLLATTG